MVFKNARNFQGINQELSLSPVTSNKIKFFQKDEKIKEAFGRQFGQPKNRVQKTPKNH
jgi:hypothetical protein